MKSGLKILTAFATVSLAVGMTALINKMIAVKAVSQNLLEETDYAIYNWRFGRIKYKKYGRGTPILLVHDLETYASSREWEPLLPLLSQKHTVYILDLLGCGISEKPSMTYTHHIFSQLITDFIKVEIGKRTSVVASGASSSFVLSSCFTDASLFEKIILISPEPLNQGLLIPGKRAKTYKAMINSPVLGTLLYHISVSKKNIKRKLLKMGFSKRENLSKEFYQSCYESAHRGLSPKSLYASLVCNFTKKNIKGELSGIDNSIIILQGSRLPGADAGLEDFININPSIEGAWLAGLKRYPHLEDPVGFYNQLEVFL